MTQQSNHLQAKLLEKIKISPSAERITTSVEDDKKYFDAIWQFFPFVGSKIDWLQVPHSFYEQIDRDNYHQSIHGFLDQIIDKTNVLENDLVVILGDSVLDVAITMPVSVLSEYLDDIVRLPQHTYIVPQNLSWCATYTMEGFMDFGFRPTR